MFGPGLNHPGSGSPWRFTDGQKRFLILWYWYDENGRYLYRRGVKRGAKGTGKDPFAAAHGNIEFAGPSLLVWDDGVGWHGVQHHMSWVQIASNSEGQSKDTLFIANNMWSNDAKAWHGIETNATKSVLQGRSRFEVLTASEKSAEGDPATFIILNESQHMTASSGGHKVEKVARRNVGKSPEEIQARIVEYTNAHAMGQDSTAEQSYIAWQQQISGDFPHLRQDILYDSVQADPNLRTNKPDELKKAISQAYLDAPWHDAYRLEGEVLDPSTPESDSIRFYLNGLAVREDAWIDPKNWDSQFAARPDIVVTDKEQITMFLDCSKSSDATGLVGVRVSDGHTFNLGIWQAERGGRGDKNWLAPRHEVDAVVREAFDRYKVMWFGVDPSPATDDATEHNYWMPTIDGWHRDFNRRIRLWTTPGATQGHSVLFDMRLNSPGAHARLKQFTAMAEQVATAIDDEHAITHDGNPALRLHVHNARKRPNQWGTSLGKESRDSNRLVDLAVCMVGAHLGRRLVLNNPKIRTGSGTRRPREVVVMN